MSSMSVDLAHLQTSELNAYRRLVMESIAELKSVERNLRLLVNQNTLDLTPTLLSNEDTGEQERLHASQTAREAISRVRQSVSSLPF